MEELSTQYFANSAKQLVLISVFFGGVATTILGTIILHESDSKILKAMVLGLSLSAVSFMVAVIAMIKVQMILAPDSPYGDRMELLNFPRIAGGMAVILGIYSLLTVIGLTGWLKSKRIGIFTTLIAIISGILIFIIF